MGGSPAVGPILGMLNYDDANSTQQFLLLAQPQDQAPVGAYQLVVRLRDGATGKSAEKRLPVYDGQTTATAVGQARASRLRPRMPHRIRRLQAVLSAGRTGAPGPLPALARHQAAVRSSPRHQSLAGACMSRGSSTPTYCDRAPG